MKDFVIHIGTSGFPIGGNAVIHRIGLVFRALKSVGCKTLIVNKHAMYTVKDKSRIGRSNGIPYVAASYFVSRPDSFLLRNLNKLTGFIGETIFLIRKRRKIHSAIISGVSFSELVYYRLLFKVLNVKLVLEYVELLTAMKSRKGFLKRINDKFMDKYSFLLCDKVIVISEYLKELAISRNSSLPLLKVPAICDFSNFKKNDKLEQKKYLMYCGSIGYLSSIEFVIDVFSRLKQENLYNGDLFLAIGVGSGNEQVFNSLKSKINEGAFSHSINLNQNVPFQKLVKDYLQAELLIVPMRNELQDIAGFHHKVGEYCAAGKPIISNNLGEISYYFRDGESAILADDYSVDSYLEKLRIRLVDKARLGTIASEGHNVGLMHLNYLNYGSKLKQFIQC